MKSTKKTERDLFRLSKVLELPNKGWRTRLAGWFGIDLSVLSNWISRDKIPKRILKLVSDRGIPQDQWAYDDKVGVETSQSAPQSTISSRLVVSYEQEPEHMGPTKLRAVEGEGLHAQTQHIEVGGQKIAVSTFSPDPGWIHQAVDKIMASDDQSVVLALESNVRVFLDKVTKELKLEQRIQKLEAELKREKNSTACFSKPEGEAGTSE